MEGTVKYHQTDVQTFKYWLQKTKIGVSMWKSALRVKWFLSGLICNFYDPQIERDQSPFDC